MGRTHIKKETMNYDNFIYLFPNMGKRKISQDCLQDYDNRRYMATPNYNGQPCTVFTNGMDLFIYNDNRKLLRNVDNAIDFRKLARPGSWFVCTGKYIKRKVSRSYHQHFFVMTDILVWGSQLLIDSSFEERMELMDSILKLQVVPLSNVVDESIIGHCRCTDIKGILKAKVYVQGFSNIFNVIKDNPLHNGLVLTKKDSPLPDIRKKQLSPDVVRCIKKRFFIF